jgi:hypothetical protein
MAVDFSCNVYLTGEIPQDVGFRARWTWMSIEPDPKVITVFPLQQNQPIRLNVFDSRYYFTSLYREDVPQKEGRKKGKCSQAEGIVLKYGLGRRN